MPSQVFEPNQFVLQNEEIELVYSVNNRTGIPQVDYQTQRSNRRQSFSSDAISAQETAIGRLITVSLELHLDRTLILTLLLPTVNLPVGVIDHPIQTAIVFTTRYLPQPGATRRVKGQVETYEIVSLRGTARLVEF